jgi:hypothetical protein
MAGRAVAGALLLLAACTLAAAAGGRDLRSAGRAAAAGSLAVLDASMISIAVVLSRQPRWPVATAVTASALRLAYALRKLPQALAS